MKLFHLLKVLDNFGDAWTVGIATKIPVCKQIGPVFPNLFDVAVPLTSLFISQGTLEENNYIFKLIFFLIISY